MYHHLYFTMHSNPSTFYIMRRDEVFPDERKKGFFLTMICPRRVSLIQISLVFPILFCVYSCFTSCPLVLPTCSIACPGLISFTFSKIFLPSLLFAIYSPCSPRLSPLVPLFFRSQGCASPHLGVPSEKYPVVCSPLACLLCPDSSLIFFFQPSSCKPGSLY